MTVVDLSEELEDETYGITPWKPVTCDGDPGLSASKFSGIPWLHAGEEWPTCKGCDEPMQFILQLDLKSLPDDLSNKFGDGLLQFFYCTNADQECEVFHESWFWNEETMVVRLVQPNDDCGSPDISPVDGAFKCLGITDWRSMSLEIPAPKEYSRYVSRKHFSYSRLPASGDKLSGWPDWIQGVEYPKCRDCEKQMRLVFQLGSKRTFRTHGEATELVISRSVLTIRKYLRSGGLALDAQARC